MVLQLMRLYLAAHLANCVLDLALRLAASERRRLRGNGFTGSHDHFAELDAHNWAELATGLAGLNAALLPAQTPDAGLNGAYFSGTGFLVGQSL
jgi:hypothetical protein